VCVLEHEKEVHVCMHVLFMLSKFAVTVPSVSIIFLLLFILLLSDSVWVFMVT
jgi:hypothetical protein